MKCKYCKKDAGMRRRSRSNGTIYKVRRKICPECEGLSKNPIIIYECKCKIGKKVNHHFDYYRPFEVIKLCHRCHVTEHYRLKNLGITLEIPEFKCEMAL